MDTEIENFLESAKNSSIFQWLPYHKQYIIELNDFSLKFKKEAILIEDNKYVDKSYHYKEIKCIIKNKSNFFITEVIANMKSSESNEI